MRSGLHSRALPSGVGRSNIFTVAKAELEVLRKKAKEIESLVCQFIIKGHMWVLLPLAHSSQRPFPGSKEGMSPSEEHLEAASLWTVCCSACYLYEKIVPLVFAVVHRLCQLQMHRYHITCIVPTTLYLSPQFLGHIRHFQADGTLWKLWSWFE